MMKSSNIQVWLDTTSEPGEATWIVSREHCDADGEQECSETLSVHESLDDALAAADRVLSHDASCGVEHALIECPDCGIWVQGEADKTGCGMHCGNCGATL